MYVYVRERFRDSRALVDGMGVRMHAVAGQDQDRENEHQPERDSDQLQAPGFVVSVLCDSGARGWTYVQGVESL